MNKQHFQSSLIELCQQIELTVANYYYQQKTSVTQFYHFFLLSAYLSEFATETNFFIYGFREKK